ncbi:DUF4167 domain-containing protein [Aureimonas sp. SA4125]|uniref:DUF4167 domain-containing protein n=1 Tax=Aureimonas sp. SA4125 TaxID=2826993 RepID=UPI001CC53C47|nr:DUF4167 domain-containing protein [Aureimonas sp. SA4125]
MLETAGRLSVIPTIWNRSAQPNTKYSISVARWRIRIARGKRSIPRDGPSCSQSNRHASWISRDRKSMRPGQQQQNKQRMRGRGRKGPNPLSRSYESNGPDVKIRGTAQHIAEKYSTLARDSAASGDRVMAENYLQHAEHYGRIVAAAQGTFQLQQDENDFGDQTDEDGEDEGGSENGYANGNGNGNEDRGQNDRNQYDRNQNDRNQGDRNQADRNQGERYQTDRGQNDRSQGERQQGERFNGQPNAQREGRDQRGGNGAPQSASGNRDGNREARDGNRDNRGNDSRGNENRGNRDSASRDENRGNRDGNRENRDGFQARDRDNRGNRDNRDRQAPNGLGPQPVVSEPRAPIEGGEEQAPRLAGHEQPRNAELPQRIPAAETVSTESAPREEFRPRSEEAQGEPRRRGRPRRVRSEDGEQRAPAAADLASGGEPVATASPAPVAADPVIATAPVAPTAPVEARAETPPTPQPPTPQTETSPVDAESKVKRKPGRPRKKKPDDDSSGGEDGGDHLPAFLMATNS